MSIDTLLGPDPFKWVDLNQLNDPPPAEVKFLWGDATNGLLQESSFMLLHSAEKQGKSMFMLNLAIAAARCDSDFLGFKIREGGFKTLILQCEVHMRAIWERFEEMKKNGGLTFEQNKRINVNGYRAVTLSNPKSLPGSAARLPYGNLILSLLTHWHTCSQKMRTRMWQLEGGLLRCYNCGTILGVPSRSCITILRQVSRTVTVPLSNAAEVQIGSPLILTPSSPLRPLNEAVGHAAGCPVCLGMDAQCHRYGSG